MDRDQIFHLIEEMRELKTKQELKVYLEKINSEDTSVLGLIAFMRDNNYDIESLESFVKTPQNQPKILLKSKAQPRTILLWAAVITLFISTLLIVQNLSDSSRLPDRFNIVDPGFPVYLNSSATSASIDWMNKYKEGNFDAALELAEVQLRTHPSSDTLNYYIGMIHFQKGSFTEAQKHFTKVNSRSNSYGIRSKYYLGLIYFEEQNTDAALILLRDVADSGIPIYSKKARELMELKAK